MAPQKILTTLTLSPADPGNPADVAYTEQLAATLQPRPLREGEDPRRLDEPVRLATVDRWDVWCDAVARIEGPSCTRNDVHQDPAASWAYDRDFTPREFHQGFWQ